MFARLPIGHIPKGTFSISDANHAWPKFLGVNHFHILGMRQSTLATRSESILFIRDNLTLKERKKNKF